MKDLKLFITQYCPNPEYNMDGSISAAPSDWSDEQKELWAYYDLFPKAIAQYRYELCLEQRKNCAESLSGSILSYRDSCLYADSPDI